MEEWEDELQNELNSILEDYEEKGITIRQIIGVLETLKYELISNNLIVFEPEE